MKGILFTDFIEFMEHELPAAVGKIEIGAYSPLGSYPAEELLGLVARAGEVSGLPAQEVLRRFGAHLFRTLATLYPIFIDGVGSSLELLGGIETNVHGEVKKLYPDTEFPRFEVRARTPGGLELDSEDSRRRHVVRRHEPGSTRRRALHPRCCVPDWQREHHRVQHRQRGN